VKRIAIVNDGKNWFVRRIASSIHDGESDEMVYFCDEPIEGSHISLASAVVTAELYLAGHVKIKTRRTRKAGRL
jgi:hypothetical protein